MMSWPKSGHGALHLHGHIHRKGDYNLQQKSEGILRYDVGIDGKAMIYITGDCHANFTRFNTENFPEQSEMTKDDYIIICGDFGGVWNKDEESLGEKWWMDGLEDKPFTTLFVDGNHENFDRLYAYSVEEWNGGNVHRIRPSVIHLMRGQVFTIEEKVIFTFGGAKSHDTSGGILELDDPDFYDKRKTLEEDWKPYRINHLSRWERELPTVEEMDEGRRNLEVNGNKVDFIVTHCCASSTQAYIGEGMFQPDILTKYFQEIVREVEYKKWFFGHYHDDRSIGDKGILIYEQIIRIA